MGTEIVRPSSRSTDRESSVIVTLTTLARVSVTAAECIPFIYQDLQILTDDALNIAQLLSVIAIIVCQCYVGVKPEFGAPILSVHVHMAWLAAIVRVEVDAIGTDSQCSWHSYRYSTPFFSFLPKMLCGGIVWDLCS